MNFIKKTFSFFIRIFSKENNIKMIETPIKPVPKVNEIDLVNAIRGNVIEKKKIKVETLTCFGDGLGIQTKINF